MAICNDLIKTIALLGTTAMILTSQTQAEQGTFSIPVRSENNVTGMTEFAGEKKEHVSQFMPTIWNSETDTWEDDEGKITNTITNIIHGVPTEQQKTTTTQLEAKINDFVTEFYKKNKMPEYNEPNWICVDYAKTMIDAARKEGLPAYIAIGTQPTEHGQSHAFVAFDIADRMKYINNYKPDKNKDGLYAPSQFVLYDPTKPNLEFDPRANIFTSYSNIEILKDPIYYTVQENNINRLFKTAGNRAGVTQSKENILRFQNKFVPELTESIGDFMETLDVPGKYTTNVPDTKNIVGNITAKQPNIIYNGIV